MFWAVVGECRGEARKTTFVWIFSVSRQEEPSSVVKPPPLQRVHVISSQDIHRIYLNKNLQLQMSCDYFSDYLRGFQWCHKRGSSLLSDLRQSSYKLAPFIFIRTNRKDCGPGLSSLSLHLAPELAGLNLHKSGLTVSRRDLYFTLLLTTSCFYEEKQMCFSVSTKQSNPRYYLYTECSNYKQGNCCSKTETVIFNIFPNLPSSLPPSLLFFSRKNTTKELVVENNFSCLLPSILSTSASKISIRITNLRMELFKALLSTVKRCFICF